MDHDQAFPNPIERTDLPQPRKKLRYVIVGLILLFILTIIFLPQLVASKVGRNVLKSWIESKYRGKAWIGEMKTSWMGSTTIEGFSLVDPEGRSIRFARLECGMPLGKILASNFELEDAVIKDLSLEYVIDYGDGSDTLDRLSADWRANAVAPTPGANKPRMTLDLPKLSGDITLQNATITLTRGQIYDKMYRTVYRSAKFSNINGTVSIDSLDEPWTCDLAGRVGGEDTGGTFTVSGKIDLGEGGKLDANKMAADVMVMMRDVPNAATPGSGSLGWVLLSLIPAEDYGQMFGPVIKTLDMQVKVGDGKLRFEKFAAVGEIDKKVTRLSGHPTLDLVATPRRLGVDGPTVANVQLTRELARRLAYAVPFLQDSAGGGELQLHIDELSTPVVGSLRKMSGKGSLSIKDATLISGQVLSNDPFPRELTTQWQAVVGDTSPAVKINAPQVKFKIENGKASWDPYEITLNDVKLAVSGETEMQGGKLTLNIATDLPETMRKQGLGNAVTLPVTGTVEQPKLEPSLAANGADRQKFAQAVDAHIVELKERKRERLLLLSDKQVKDITAPFDRIITGTTQSTQPTTQPSK